MNGIIPELVQALKELGGGAICFSGGLDSTVLLRNAMEAVPERYFPVFFRMPMNTERQIVSARRIASFLGCELSVIDLCWNDLPGVELNGPDRCYRCKTAMYAAASAFASSRGVSAVLAGENADDAHSDRPGRRAGKEKGIICPLEELDIGRAAIEAAVKELELPVPMFKDTCLATRYPVGEPIDEYSMRFAESCEDTVRVISDVHQLRVRIDGSEATLQTDPSETWKLERHLPEIEGTFMMKGLKVTIDRNGYENKQLTRDG